MKKLIAVGVLAVQALFLHAEEASKDVGAVEGKTLSASDAASTVLDCVWRLLRNPDDTKAGYDLVECAFKQGHYASTYNMSWRLFAKTDALTKEEQNNLGENIFQYSEIRFLKGVYGIPGFAERDDALSWRLCDAAEMVLERCRTYTNCNQEARRELAENMYAAAYGRDYSPLNVIARCRHAELVRPKDPARALEIYAGAIKSGYRGSSALRPIVELAGIVKSPEAALWLVGEVFEYSPRNIAVLDAYISALRLAGKSECAEDGLRYREALVNRVGDPEILIPRQLLLKMLRARSKDAQPARPRMRYCDDGLTDAERKAHWPFDVEGFEYALTQKMNEDDSQWLYRVKAEFNDYGEKEIDEGDLAEDPSVRWVARKTLAWATNVLDKTFRRMKDEEMCGMYGSESAAAGRLGWHLGGDEYFLIDNASAHESLEISNYTFVRWQGKDALQKELIASFNTFPCSRAAVAARLFGKSPAAKNNLAAFVWNGVAVSDVKENPGLEKMLESANEGGVKAAAGNLKIFVDGNGGKIGTSRP